jgi:phospholipase/carboxylesterase
MLSRRQLLLLASTAAVARCVPARQEHAAADAEAEDVSGEGDVEERTEGWSTGRIGARPASPSRIAAVRGEQPLGLGRRDGVLYVPDGYDPSRAAPLLLVLHGAGGSGARALRAMQPYADRYGIIVVAPDSARRTWDLIAFETVGPDAERIDAALGTVFERYAIDAACLGVSGFSDGASYALTLGVANGDLFTHLIAFSPGFLRATAQVGQPAVFISHGEADDVLPVRLCSRRIVPRLQRAGYAVRYHEFEGGHEVPAGIATEAVDWFVKDAARSA